MNGSRKSETKPTESQCRGRDWTFSMESSRDLTDPVSKVDKAQIHDLHRGGFRAGLVRGAPQLIADLCPVSERRRHCTYD